MRSIYDVGFAIVNAMLDDLASMLGRNMSRAFAPRVLAHQV